MAGSNKFSLASRHQLAKGNKFMFAISDDNAMMKQITATHDPDDRDVDTRSLLHLVENILKRATLAADPMGSHELESLEKTDTNQAGFTTMLEALSYTIDRISSEISYKALEGIDPHATSLAIFNMLANYQWDAKLVLTLAAFAMNYGEFWLLAQIHSQNQLAKAMAIFKQLPGILEHSTALKPKFDALKDLVTAILEVTWCIIDLKELPSEYISQEVPAMSTAVTHIPTAVYWTIRSIVTCATQTTSLTSMGYELALSTSTESWELSTLAHKLKNIHDHLKKQLSPSFNAEEKRDIESFQMLVRLFEMTHLDNMKVLKALIYAKDDLQPIVDGSTGQRVNLDVLKRRNVLLLISDLNISHDELSILDQLYNESRAQGMQVESQFEVVWIPIVDHSIKWDDLMQKRFEYLLSIMPWHIVHHPTLISKAVARFIREVWQFRNKPILVVLDPQGKVVSPNAIHMMWIWGSLAFPFTSLKEEALWREETWRPELLVDGIDPAVLNWIKEEKYVFLYGGDDIEWIRKFTITAKMVAQAARIPLEMVYVGKSSKRERVRQIITTITTDKLGYCWSDLTMIWFFWTRIESMLFSKIQLGKADDRDPLMQEIKKLLSYDKEGGWAVLSKGSTVIVNGHSTTVLPTLVNFDSWKQQAADEGFDVAFKNHHDELQGITHPCCRFEFPHTTGRIPENFKCPECDRHMEKLTTFLCCHDEKLDE
ncbi:Protein SIEVE ELEMENT OCCLUSION B, partial [Cucurbita argyrosperma subsp. argyrosperma]